MSKMGSGLEHNHSGGKGSPIPRPSNRPIYDCLLATTNQNQTDYLGISKGIA